MEVLKAIMAFVGPAGAVLLLVCSAIHMIAPKWFSRHIVLKTTLLKIGFIMVLVGVIGIFLFSKK